MVESRSSYAFSKYYKKSFFISSKNKFFFPKSILHPPSKYLFSLFSPTSHWLNVRIFLCYLLFFWLNFFFSLKNFKSYVLKNKNLQLRKFESKLDLFYLLDVSIFVDSIFKSNCSDVSRLCVCPSVKKTFYKISIT